MSHIAKFMPSPEICQHDIFRDLYSFNKKSGKLYQAALMELLMEFAFVATVGGVGLEDVAVARFQFFEDAGFIHRTGADIVS